MEDRLLKISTIAREKIVDVSTRHLRELARSGALPFIQQKPKGDWYILESVLQHCVKKMYFEALGERIRRGEVKQNGIIAMEIQQEGKPGVPSTGGSNRRKKVSTQDSGDLFEERGGRLVEKVQ